MPRLPSLEPWEPTARGLHAAAELVLPAPAHWNTAPWKGLALHYEDLRQSDEPEALIEATLETVYALLAPTLLQRAARSEGANQ